MGAHMKSTIDITDTLFLQAKQRAAAEGTTLKALVEAGLRHVLAQKGHRAPAFKLRTAAVKGKGLHDQMQGTSWERVREMAYEGRGG
jgi:hypothetical protein